MLIDIEQGVKSMDKKGTEVKRSLLTFIENNGDKTLAEIFDVQPVWFTTQRIENLDMSQRATSCLIRYLDPPLSSPNGVHLTTDEILNLTAGQFFMIRNLGIECSFEIWEKLNEITAYYRLHDEITVELRNVNEIGESVLRR